ncbi:MAG TPA: adenylate/guanylate cyclase domain-containing protein [Stellaceae bacterium]|jgi:adenylate cyclase|nr:adenylate/guanylate cyclase domain-containing protein [Stellaceae bacterium]
MTESRKLAAILASDVVGYSRLTGADEEGTVARLRALKADLLDPTIAAHRGRTVKTAGDGMLIEFASVVDAVRAAVDVQNGMVARNASVAAERQIQFRIGIHLGDVLIESDGDLMGDGVNIAARLEGICEPGGICLSEDAWRQVRDKIDVSFSDLGERELKNIARPVRVYALPPSPPRWGGEGQDEVGNDRARGTTSPSRAGGAGPALSAPRRGNDGPPRLSIVVLPFANMSGDAEQEYFVDGLTEDLTTELSRMPDAFVIARNTAFTYKGKAADVKQIGRELGVRYALEGSVRKAGSRVRFNAQLLDAATGAHLWADRFDRELVDLFDLQDSVTQELAGVMNVQLVDAETRRGQNKLDPDALDLVLRARAAANRGASRENFAESLRLFEAALARDPGNVAAMCGIVVERVARVSSLWSEDRAGDIAAAETMARRAQALDPKNPEVRFAVGFVRRIQMRFDEAIAELSAVLRDNPNNALAHNEMGWALGFSGRDREAIGHFEESIRRNPRDPLGFLGYFGIGYLRYEMSEYEASVAVLRQAIALNPYFSWSHLMLTASQSSLGRETEARDALAAYFRTNPAVKTIAALRANPVSPRLADAANPFHEALRRAGMPEE